MSALREAQHPLQVTSMAKAYLDSIPRTSRGKTWMPQEDIIAAENVDAAGGYDSRGKCGCRRKAC
jgi:hypothetical protein